MNDTPNPSPGPTVEEMLIAIFRLLVVVAIVAVTTTVLLIMAAYGTPQPSGSAHVDQLLYRGQLHTAASSTPPPTDHYSAPPRSLGLIERTCKNHYRITERGRELLGDGEPETFLPPDGDYRSHKSRLYRNQDGKCVLCNGQFNYENMEIDHITPRSRGGSDAVENLQLLCRQCNRRKSARSQSEAVGIVRR